MTTYTELLRRKSVTCSCCGRDAHPLTATAYTGMGDVVTWVMCRQCEAVCDGLHHGLGQVECPIAPCKDPDGKAEGGWISGISVQDKLPSEFERLAELVDQQPPRMREVFHLWVAVALEESGGGRTGGCYGFDRNRRERWPGQRDGLLFCVLGWES